MSKKQQRLVSVRQWLICTFHQKASLPVDEWLRLLEQLEEVLQRQDSTALAMINTPFDNGSTSNGHHL